MHVGEPQVRPLLAIPEGHAGDACGGGGRELPAHDELPVRAEKQGLDLAAEGGVDGAPLLTIEARETLSRRGARTREAAAGDQVAIRESAEGVDFAIQPAADWGPAAAIPARDVGRGRAAGACEGAAGDDIALGLTQERVDRAVRALAEGHKALSGLARHVAELVAIAIGEGAADEDFLGVGGIDDASHFCVERCSRDGPALTIPGGEVGAAVGTCLREVAPDVASRGSGIEEQATGGFVKVTDALPERAP
jgi:hypothetical protein